MMKLFKLFTKVSFLFLEYWILSDNRILLKLVLESRGFVDFYLPPSPDPCKASLVFSRRKWCFQEENNAYTQTERERRTLLMN